MAVTCTGTVPAAEGPGDLYVMRVVLHDWSDEKTLEILTAVREAIGELSGTTAVRLWEVVSTQRCVVLPATQHAAQRRPTAAPVSVERLGFQVIQLLGHAGASGATLVIVEMMPSDALQPFGITETAAMLDVHMLAMADGMERTKVMFFSYDTTVQGLTSHTSSTCMYFHDACTDVQVSLWYK